VNISDVVAEALLAGRADAIIAADRDGIIRFWNPGAERLWKAATARSISGNYGRIAKDRRSRHAGRVIQTKADIRS